jgi:hypothetical protein
MMGLEAELTDALRGTYEAGLCCYALSANAGEGAQLVLHPTPPTTPATTGQYKQLDFNFTVPKGKVASLMGVLNYLQSKYEHMNISLHLDRGQMTEQEYEDKVKEAFRQMGIEIK